MLLKGDCITAIFLEKYIKFKMAFSIWRTRTRSAIGAIYFEICIWGFSECTYSKWRLQVKCSFTLIDCNIVGRLRYGESQICNWLSQTIQYWRKIFVFFCGWNFYYRVINMQITDWNLVFGHLLSRPLKYLYNLVTGEEAENASTHLTQSRWGVETMDSWIWPALINV